MSVSIPVIVGGTRGSVGEPTTLAVRSPATGELVAEMTCATSEDVDRAVLAASAAARTLAALSPRQRADLLVAAASVIEHRSADIATDLAREQGKPIVEARDEVAGAVSMWRETAEILRHLGDSVLPSDDPDWSVLVLRRPHGVVGVITPWNFPASIPTEYLAAGLAMGNAIVWKPSELTPLTALHLVECIQDAGFPSGAINLVPGRGADVGAMLTAHAGVDAIGFTGSPGAGAAVARSAGPKPLLLELGGNNATVVLGDADIAATARAMLPASYTNAGQTCAATERVFVERSAYTDLCAALVEEVQTLRVGTSLDESATIGPLNNEVTATKVDRHLADAVDRGAQILTGGRRASGWPTDLFYEPTVFGGLTREMAAFREETFGPVVGLMPFDGDDEVVDLVNGHALGLVAGVLGTDLDRATAIARRLDAGIVNIGQTASSWQPHTPFGGFSGKSSGVGRLGGRYTMEALSQLQTFVMPRRRLP